MEKEEMFKQMMTEMRSILPDSMELYLLYGENPDTMYVSNSDGIKKTKLGDSNEEKENGK